MPEEKKGEFLIFTETILSGLFPVLIAVSFFSMPPIAALAWNTLFAALFFGGIMLYRKTWHVLFNLRLWQYVAVITVCISIGYHVLFFIGLTETSSGNASIIALFEILVAYVLFNVIRKERFPLEHKIGACFMILGALVVLSKNLSAFAIGDFFILAATFTSPPGNLFQRKARDIASSEAVLFLRSALAVPFLFLFSHVLGEPSSALSASTLLILLVNGIMLMGISKWLWLEAIHRISITKALVLKSLSPLLTLVFAWLLLNEHATLWQFASLPLCIAGVLLLTGHFSFSKSRSASI